jgi:uncharacterized protein YbaP (TraB family)
MKETKQPKSVIMDFEWADKELMGICGLLDGMVSLLEENKEEGRYIWSLHMLSNKVYKLSEQAQEVFNAGMELIRENTTLKEKIKKLESKSEGVTQ